MESDAYTHLAFLFDSLMGTKNVEKECNTLEDIFHKHYLLKPTILDFGCGTGLHTIELSNRGYNILGIDKSQHMIDIAKEKCDIDIFKCIDIMNIQDKFDVCISMWNVIGYITNIYELDEMFSKINSLVEKNGLFIFDCFNGIAVNKHKPKETFKMCKINNKLYFRCGTPIYEPMKQRFSMIYEYYSNDDYYKEVHKMKILYPDEVKKYLSDNGFELLDITNVYDGKPATKDDWDIRYICRVK